MSEASTVPALAGAAGAPEHAALGDLVAAARELMLAVSTTARPDAELHTAAAGIRELAASLAVDAHPRVHKVRLLPPAAAAVRAGEPWQCFPFNVQGIPYVIEVDGERARAAFTPGALLEGPPEHLHGGFAAAVIDAFLGTLVQVAVTPSFTATLDLRYVGPVLLDVPVEVVGQVVSVSGRKVVAECTISQDGRAAVEARGLFVAVEGSGVAAVEARVRELEERGADA